MSTFYIIATPIGNMEDITLRGIRILSEVDIVLCEDTRVTKRIFEKYNINTPMISYHAQSGEAKIEIIFEKVQEGKNIALVTDAGTPGISDPGSMLISQLREKFSDNIKKGELKIVSVPGPSALTSAISIAGVPTHEFIFLGFMPHKKGRETIFNEIKESERTIIFYESPHRLMKTLESLKTHLSGLNKKVTIVREITKIYEEVIQGSADEVFDIVSSDDNKQRGEFVILVSTF